MTVKQILSANVYVLLPFFKSFSFALFSYSLAGILPASFKPYCFVQSKSHDAHNRPWHLGIEP